MREASTDREAKFGGPPPSRSVEQRWVLATQGILTELNGTSHLRVGGEPRPMCSGVSSFRLRQHWGIRNAREARKCIEWLLAEGHRFGYARDDDRSPDDYLGWDLVRASCVAGWSFVAYHLELAEVWAAMLRSARMLREKFGSWSDVGMSYARGRERWGGHATDEIVELTNRLVLPGGGWDLPWAVDLAVDVPPPTVEPMPELVVSPAGEEGAFTTINEALRSTKAPKRVVVRAGVYAESVRIESPVELVADGEVKIVNGKGAPLSVDHHAFIRGFHLEAGHDEKDGTMQAVWIGDNFAKLVDCTMRTERCAIYAGKDGANVFVEGCRAIEPSIHGVLAQEGAHIAVTDTVIESPKGCGVLGEGNGEMFLEDVRVVGAEQPSISFRGETKAEVLRLRVERAGANGIEVLGSATAELVEAHVADAKGTGLLVMSNGYAGVRVHASTLTGNGANDLGVLQGRVAMSGTTLGGGLACAIAVQNDSRLQLEGCKVRSSAQPSLWLMGRSTTVVLDCAIDNERELAVYANPGSTIHLVSCEVSTRKKQAVVLRGVSEGSLDDSRIEGVAGALHVDQGAQVDVRGGALVATGSDDAPALAVQEEASVVVIGATIAAAGDAAISAESGARLRLTRTAVDAGNGAAVKCAGADVRALGGIWRAKSPSHTEGEGALGVTGLACEGATALDLDVSPFHPDSIALRHRDALGWSLHAEFVAAALREADVPVDAVHAVLWLDELLANERFEAAFELSRWADSVIVESESARDLSKIQGLVDAALRDREQLRAIASGMHARRTGTGAERDADGDAEEHALDEAEEPDMH